MRIPGRTTDFTWFTEKTGDGPREEAQAGNCRVSAPVDCLDGSPAGRYRAKRDFLGFQEVRSAVIGGSPLRYITRTIPYEFPTPPAAPGRPLYASSLVQGQGIGPATENGEGTSYPRYRWTATFESRPYKVFTDEDVAADSPSPLWDAANARGYPHEGFWLGESGISTTRFVERKVLPFVNIYSAKGGWMRFVDGTAAGTPIEQPFVYREGGAIVVYTWHCVPFPEGVPLKQIFASLQCLNSGPNKFDSFPPETLLFETFEHDNPYPGPGGDWLTTVRYRMRFLPHFDRAGVARGWNYLRRQFAGVWDYQLITSTGLGGGNKLYEVAPFSELFVPDPIP